MRDPREPEWMSSRDQFRHSSEKPRCTSVIVLRSPAIVAACPAGSRTPVASSFLIAYDRTCTSLERHHLRTTAPAGSSSPPRAAPRASSRRRATGPATPGSAPTASVTVPGDDRVVAGVSPPLLERAELGGIARGSTSRRARFTRVGRLGRGRCHCGVSRPPAPTRSALAIGAAGGAAPVRRRVVIGAAARVTRTARQHGEHEDERARARHERPRCRASAGRRRRRDVRCPATRRRASAAPHGVRLGHHPRVAAAGRRRLARARRR